MEEAWKRKQEAEAEAVDGRLEEAEAEAKEKFTAVASLVFSLFGSLGFAGTVSARTLKIWIKI